MHIKKSVLVAGAVAGISLVGLGGLGVASAAASTDTRQDSIVDRIATKFNLKKEDVKAVFDEERTAREAEHKQKMEDRLTQAVKDGKITETQKAKILAKLDELQAARDTWQDKTPQERHQAMQGLHKSLQQWAKDNGIPSEYAPIGIVMHHPGGPGLMMKHPGKVMEMQESQ